jgi:GTP cyclohydrolase IB
MLQAQALHYPQINKMPLADIQEKPDTRGITIQEVGIQDLKYPIHIQNEQGTTQASVGTFDLAVSLNPTQRGAHLSRFIEVLEAHPRYFSTQGDGFDTLLHLIQTKSHADDVFLKLAFPFFMEKRAPETQIKSLMDYAVTIKAEKHGAAAPQLETTIQVPVTSVCPCSRAISQYGAHNQRSLLTLRVSSQHFVPIEQWIRLLEQQGSAELFALLKRPDEKWVTEQAYRNAKFVEDIVRDVALALNQDDNVLKYHITAHNIESIHHHAAFAEIFSSE